MNRSTEWPDLQPSRCELVELQTPSASATTITGDDTLDLPQRTLSRLPQLLRAPPIGRFHRLFVVSLLVVAGAIVAGCSDETPSSQETRADGESAENSSELEQRIERFCGDCHEVPDPAAFPKDAWYEEVAQGYRFYRESGRHDLQAPPMAQVVDFYRARAPDSISLRPPETSDSPVRFLRESVPIESDPDFAGVSHLYWIAPGTADASGTLLTTDMRSGWVGLMTFEGRSADWEPLARLSNPAHITPTDLDDDGRLDYVVAELGSFLPEDHDKGQVVWLRRASGGQEMEVMILRDGLGRVADVQPGDFDRDGDLDLIVAEFGWRSTGRLLLLERISPQVAPESFELKTVDPRHGAIHVPVTDFDGDGLRDDVVALISQEHECIVALIGEENRDDGKTFGQQALYRGPDPSYGSSGIQLTDLDQDGDIDVLYTNGDTLDSFYLKPFHAVRWLENDGRQVFREHELFHMPGVYRAETGDLDNDGDLDVVACAALPDNLHSRLADNRFETLVWLEQTRPGEFSPRRLDRRLLEHMALTTGDFDRDGDLDIAVGGHGPNARSEPLSIWWNEGRTDGN